jgi:hypothetical protein
VNAQRVNLTKHRAEICQLYREGVDVADLSARYGVNRPAILRALHLGGAREIQKAAGGRKRGRKAGRAIDPVVVAANSAPIFVSRDPCPRCAIRADIGCAHSHAPLMVRV